MFHRLVAMTVAGLLGATLLLAAPPASKISAELQSARPSDMVDVIIQWGVVPTTKHRQKVHDQGGTDKADFVYLSADRNVSQLLNISAPAVNAPVAWQQGYVGTGVGVAIIDSGVNLIDLESRVVYSEAFDENGSGHDTAVISAIARAVQLKNTYNIRIINLSLGRPVFESYKLDPLCQAVEAAWNAGIVVVVAAGNNGRDNSQGTNGYGTIEAPANDPYVITVGAMKNMGTVTRSDNLIARYSSKGPTLLDHVVKPDLVAPGNYMVSSLQKNAVLYGEFPGNQVYLSSYTGNPIR